MYIIWNMYGPFAASPGQGYDIARIATLSSSPGPHTRTPNAYFSFENIYTLF